MRSLPGKYWVYRQISRKRPIRLVSMMAAKELALTISISEEAMARDLVAVRSAGLAIEKCFLLQWRQAAPSAQPDLYYTLKTRLWRPYDVFGGMPSIPFAFLSAGNQAEQGIWCMGCEHMNGQGAASILNPEEAHAERERLYAMLYTARPSVAFIEHLKNDVLAYFVRMSIT